MRPAPQALFAAIAGLIVLAVVVAGMLVVGSPRQARLRSLDDQRVAALQTLSNALDGFQKAHDALPDTLARLAEDRNGLTPAAMRDPETGAPYGYRRTGAAAYELCARFATTTDEGAPIRWRHGPGRVCFDLAAAAKTAAP